MAMTRTVLRSALCTTGATPEELRPAHSLEAAPTTSDLVGIKPQAGPGLWENAVSLQSTWSFGPPHRETYGDLARAFVNTPTGLAYLPTFLTVYAAKPPTTWGYRKRDSNRHFWPLYQSICLYSVFALPLTRRCYKGQSRRDS